MIRLCITVPATRVEHDELGFAIKSTSVIVEVDPDNIRGAQDDADGAMRLGDILRAHPLTSKVRRQDERVRVWTKEQ